MADDSSAYLGEPRVHEFANDAEPGVARARRHVGEEPVALEPQHAKVRDDLSLRGERRGVLSLAGRERAHVVGDQPGQHLPRLGARERHARAMAAIHDDRAASQRLVLGGDVRLRQHDRLAADVDECLALHHDA
jgi:hypothetical protein